MKRFAFALDSVMKYRDYEKEQAQIELGRALSAEGRIQGQIDTLNRRSKEAAASVKGSNDFHAIESYHEFHILVEQKLSSLMVQLEAAKKASEEKRGLMKTALQKSEAVHKLYDRQLEEYREKSFHEEIEIQDDIATARHNKDTLIKGM